MKKGTHAVNLLLVCSLLLAAGLLSSLSARQAGKYKLAVLTVKTTGTYAPTLSGDLTFALQRAFAAYPIFEVMPEAEVDEGLYLGGIRQDLCHDFSCAIKAGKALDATVVVFGSVRQEGAFNVVDFSMVHVTSGKLVKRVQDEIEGGSTDLIAYMGDVADGLTGRKKIVARKRSVANKLVASTEPVSESYYGESSATGYSESIAEEESFFPSQNSATVVSAKSGVLKWTLIGALLATGAGAGIYFGTQGGSDTGDSANSGNTGPVSQLPGPPPFTGGK